MAGQAAVVDFLGGGILEREDFRDVAAAGDVGCSGTMASFAALLRGATVRVVQCLPVRSLLVAVVHVLRGKSCKFPSRRNRRCPPRRSAVYPDLAPRSSGRDQVAGAGLVSDRASAIEAAHKITAILATSTRESLQSFICLSSRILSIKHASR